MPQDSPPHPEEAGLLIVPSASEARKDDAQPAVSTRHHRIVPSAGEAPECDAPPDVTTHRHRIKHATRPNTPPNPASTPAGTRLRLLTSSSLPATATLRAGPANPCRFRPHTPCSANHPAPLYSCHSLLHRLAAAEWSLTGNDTGQSRPYRCRRQSRTNESP